MGIRGLTTYISNHSDSFLQSFDLHNTYLVIDGNCIACQLYQRYKKSNCIFGGDYDKYSRYVSEFFSDLLKCNVTPLVIIDGGSEDKKLRTIISRTKEKLQRGLQYTAFLHCTNKFLPLLLRNVFKDVMDDKGIKYVQCLFEADNTIAAIARILNCPVLSFDSDFYIYGSLYIPFDTWENFVFHHPSGNGYVKHCKIYRVEKLFQLYNGLNRSLLPLAAILLGNDYVKQETFKSFFRHLKLPPLGKKKYNDQQRRIDATFNWLRGHTLNQAVIGILSKLQKQERKRVLSLIETTLDSYVNESLSVLHMFGIPPEHYSKASMETSKPYKFQGDICDLTTLSPEKNEKPDLSDSDEMDEEIANMLQEKEKINDESMVNTIPQWFIDEFKLGSFPSYFMDIIIRKLYVCPVQIEDYSSPSSINASLNVIRVIYALLVSVANGKKTCLEYITRDDKNTIKHYQLEYCETVHDYQLPLSSNLRELPIASRRDIMNVTLGIECESYLKEIPADWTLYIAIIKYWIDQQKETCDSTCHVYSLLIAVLFQIIDDKMGIYRNLNKYHKNFEKAVKNIQYARRKSNYNPRYSSDATLEDAIREVNADDCLIAAPFFIFNFEMDEKLYVQPKRMNVAIIHGFAEFQNCIRHALNLNALLECPYESTRIAKLFNGTLLYNVCNNFKRRDNVEAYINQLLKDSPSLLRVFNILLSKVKPLFRIALERKGRKRHRLRKRAKKCTVEEENREENRVEESRESEEIFHDDNNPYSVLSATH